MDSRTATERAPSPEAIEFVRFCHRRRRVGWPELYDEMCAVAARGLYRGWGIDELNQHGIGFCLFELAVLAALVSRVVAEDHERSARPSAAAVRAVHATATLLESPVEPSVALPVRSELAPRAVAQPTPEHTEGPVAPGIRFVPASVGA